MADLAPEKRSKILHKKLIDIFSEIKAIRESAKVVEDDTSKFSAFRGKFLTLNDLYKDYVQSWDKLYEIYVDWEKEREFPIDEKYLKAARTYLYECNAVYENIMNPIPKAAATTGPSASSTLLDPNLTLAQNLSSASMARYRLPKIDIPKFNGELSEWIRFRDIFISIVHDETSLSPIEKYHHLVGSLSGEPLRIVSAFPLAASNYSSAWKALEERYNNKRVLAASYIYKIRQFKPSSQSAFNPNYLRAFLKTVIDNFSSLTHLNIPNEGDYLKLQLALDCLDSENRKLFEERQEGKEFPTYQSLVEFIQHRCKILELSESSPPPRSYTQSSNSSKGSKVFATFAEKCGSSTKAEPSTKYHSCPKCKKDHLLFRCFTFKALPYDKKLEFIQKNQICLNCLRPGHKVNKCSSTFNCFHCNGRHHSLLHAAQPTKWNSSAKKGSSSEPAIIPDDSEGPASGIVGTTAGNDTVLLGTAMVNVRDWQGCLQAVRIVIDSGSQYSIMTAQCARRLGLPWSSHKRCFCGIGQTRLPPSKGVLKVSISPGDDANMIIETDALILPTLTSNLPVVSLPSELRKQFSNVKLADQMFYESRPVEFLLGSDLFFQILAPEPIVRISEKFGTLPTIFGHVVVGTLPDSHCQSSGNCLALFSGPHTQDSYLEKFWEIEDVNTQAGLHPDDQLCEDIFMSSVQREPDGRYMVGLPLRNPHISYPDSHSLALSRFRNLEHKLQKQPVLKEQYIEFMAEYLKLQHMEPSSTPPSYTIPHHGVFKKEVGEKNPGKFRVVFDASMQTSSGSLNDNLMVGPKLQKDISSLILNFRQHRIGFCADIVKMFRQILVRPNHRRFQHIVWRFSPEEAIQTYELCTLTYGQSSSPYLALRVLAQLADDEGGKFPQAARVLRSDVYVDDIITGADTLEDALELKSQLTSLLGKGCFPVHRWISNSQLLLESIPQLTQETEVCFSPDDAISKVLGMHWNPQEDYFSYKVELNTSEITKRSMLSIVARLFDPLGFLAPVIFLGKYFIQKLWLINIDWDDIPPDSIVKSWSDYIEGLPRLSEIRIPRWVHPSEGSLRLFGFCDASEKGYAAAIYLQVSSSDKLVRTFLLTAKTRLAPIKKVTLPRLELCAAHLLTKLLKSTQEFRSNNNITDIYLFTDSTIVLSWLRLEPIQLKTFVANRISYILTNTMAEHWKHVPSKENPADIASRDVQPEVLPHLHLWWKGPNWMNNEPLVLPPAPPVLDYLPEQKPIVSIVMIASSAANLVNSILERFSQFFPMVRTFAYVLRFIANARHNQKDNKHKKIGPLTIEELQIATEYFIRQSQVDYFCNDYDFSTDVNTSSRFRALAAFRDSSGILRVGGRLAQAQLPEDTKHPILLHPKAKLTSMIIDNAHQQNFHLGPKSLQAFLQRRYYIFQVRSTVRKRVWNCLRCYKLRVTPNNPFMGELPPSRVSQGRPFMSVGVDYAGPYLIKQSVRRNSPLSKAYLCLFVCMGTKAVHLEVVSSLTTDAFLAALDRFVSRRGLPSNIRSDCGTNFIGAARHLKDLYLWLTNASTQEAIARHSTKVGMQWLFNPPHAPHFGGLWEAAVKTAKSHLRKTLGEQAFSFEELTTIFSRIEAIMNSRPLCPVSERPNDFDHLTPGHFLIGSALITPPEQDVTDLKINTLSRWQLVQRSIQIFWKRWSNEYIHTLNTRSKWTKHSTPLKVNDLVLLQDSSTLPTNWKLGRIEQVYEGKDNIVRVVTVRTSGGILKRPVHSLCPLLPLSEDKS